MQRDTTYHKDLPERLQELGRTFQRVWKGKKKKASFSVFV